MTNKYNDNLTNLTFIHFGNSTLLSDCNYNPSKDFKFNKPNNCLWSCTYHPNNTYKSSWEEYCVNNNMNKNLEEYTLFRLKSDAKILVIDSFNDLVSTDTKYIDKCLNINTFITHNVLNIEAIQNDFDGIFITENGLKECKNIFNKWEVESLALFNTDVIVKLLKDTF